MEISIMKGLTHSNVRIVNGTCESWTKSSRYRCENSRYCCENSYKSQEPQQIRTSKKTAYPTKVSV